jgi:hypothetical protein
VHVSDLPPLIRALLKPDAYPHPVDGIELRQTHISYVLLAGDHVYKIKKPVNFGFLDFSTLGKRRFYCGREVAFNSPLCSDTYLGVVPIREATGRYAISGPGQTVEYAVHMRRLPEDRMMHHLLERGEVTTPMIEAVAEKLAVFHARAETSPRIARYGDWAIRYNTDENIAQWTPYIGRSLTAEQDRILRAYFEAFFAQKSDVLQHRIDQLRIHRVHADLRSDAVCIAETRGRPGPDDICIFDCVEFSRRLSLLDVARDVGFLQMDLDYRGREDLSRAFVDHYAEVSGDRDLFEIVEFYASYSACVRGKVEAFLLDQPEVPEREKRRARDASRRYFDLACRYAESLPPAMLVITCGLPATGKSTIARALADRGFEVISSDLVRKELAGIAPTERRLEGFQGGIYTPDFTQRTYGALFDHARSLLLAGRSVVLDASFTRREHRRVAARLARETGAQFACLFFDLPDEVIRRRLEERLRKGRDPSDARPEIFAQQKRRFQRPTEIELPRRISVPPTGALGAKMRTVIKGLRAVSPLSVR